MVSIWSNTETTRTEIQKQKTKKITIGNIKNKVRK